MGAHLQYSTDIPPLLPGQDAVNQFLFGSRIGYCEQISTALAVMLRTLGVPTREAIGYVPGPFDPLSDLYEIQAKDAHSWVQVWFPGVGWQNFDPTAHVPLAPPDPGAVLLSDLGHLIGQLPVAADRRRRWALLGAGSLTALELRRRRRRPKGWVERIAAELERRGAAAGLRRQPAETLREYALRLASSGNWRAGPAATASLAAATCTRRTRRLRVARAGRRHPRLCRGGGERAAPRPRLATQRSDGSRRRKRQRLRQARSPLEQGPDKPSVPSTAEDRGRRSGGRRVRTGQGPRAPPATRRPRRPRRRDGAHRSPASSSRTGPTRRKGPGRNAARGPPPASRLFAACSPCSAALVRCSSRRHSPVTGCCHRTRSPAPTTPAAAVSDGSHLSPAWSTSSPDPFSQDVAGIAPTATSNAVRARRSCRHSAGTSRPMCPPYRFRRHRAWCRAEGLRPGRDARERTAHQPGAPRPAAAARRGARRRSPRRRGPAPWPRPRDR